MRRIIEMEPQLISMHAGMGALAKDNRIVKHFHKAVPMAKNRESPSGHRSKSDPVKKRDRVTGVTLDWFSRELSVAAIF